MAVENALAYYGMAAIEAVKSIIVQTPGANPIKLFPVVIYEFSF
jgi:hypothetical protein